LAVAERRPLRGLLGLALTATCLCDRPPTQSPPSILAAVAGAAERAAVPAIDWLCGSHLPRRAEWPRGRDPALPFAVRIDGRGVAVLADVVALPRGVVAAGTVAIDDTEVLRWACRDDGTEDWFVAPSATVPAAWLQPLAELRADAIGAPRSLDAGVVIAHLAGALAEGDPRADLLRLGGAACGEVTWTAWSTPAHLRVRGRSGGGLLLPAALLWLARDGDAAATPALALRAFAARDGDRAEAARQGVRAPGAATERALGALLHADDQVAFAAVDALRRLGAANTLPQIVAAAGPDAPWTSLAAADALRELWPHADPATRQAARAAVQRSQSLVVRAVDLDTLAAGHVSPLAAERAAEAAAARVRAIVVLALLAVGLYGLWSRERVRLRLRGAS
jgi:hypothetical protein